MKKYIAIICLLALLLTGCGAKSDAEGEATTEAVVTTTPETEPESATPQLDLSGNWTATMNKGQYAAAIYYESQELSQEEAAEKARIFEKAEYPLNVVLNLHEDGSYYFEVKPDDGTGFEAFVVSFTAIASENGVDITEDDARQILLDARLDKLFLMGRLEEGTWSLTDQGLLLSGWCTVQFRQEGNNLHWDSCDDVDFAEDLPLSFKKNA